MTLQGPVSQTSASSVTLSTSTTTYVYTGSSAATWTLPAVSGNTGIVLLLANRGAAPVTVTAAGSDHIYQQGSTTSTQLLAGAAMELVNDGTYWVMLDNYSQVPDYDNAVISAYQSALASGTALTWTHTATTGHPYGLVCLFSQNENMNPTASTAAVTFGGVTLNQLGYQYVAGDGIWIWLFGANGIPSGAQTVSVTLTRSGNTFAGFMASFTYTSVAAVGAFSTNKNAATQYLDIMPRTSPVAGKMWMAATSIGVGSGPTVALIDLVGRAAANGGAGYAFAADRGISGPEPSAVTVNQSTSDTSYSVALDLLGPSPVGPYHNAVGVNGASQTGSGSWKHVAQAGAYVLVAISSAANTSASSVTYSGTPMTLVGQAFMNNSSTQGDLQLYGISNVSVGVGTVSVTISGTGAWCGQSVSYSQVGLVGTAVTVKSTGTSLSNGPITCAANQVVLSVFGSAAGALSPAVTPSAPTLTQVGSTQALSMNQATTTQTFTATANSGPWAGIAVVLS